MRWQRLDLFVVSALVVLGVFVTETVIDSIQTSGVATPPTSASSQSEMPSLLLAGLVMLPRQYVRPVRAQAVVYPVAPPPRVVRSARSHTRTPPRQVVPALPPSVRPPVGVVQAYAERIVGPTQFSCLLPLWNRESHWNPKANNPTSSAYGIAQLLGETSHDPYVQVRHGLNYIKSRYGTSCAAWAHSERTGWY